jgi:hypothetical protein
MATPAEAAGCSKFKCLAKKWEYFLPLNCYEYFLRYSHARRFSLWLGGLLPLTLGSLDGLPLLLIR